MPRRRRTPTLRSASASSPPGLGRPPGPRTARGPGRVRSRAVDAREKLIGDLRTYAKDLFARESPFYTEAMGLMAADVEAGGPCWELLEPYAARAGARVLPPASARGGTPDGARRVGARPAGPLPIGRRRRRRPGGVAWHPRGAGGARPGRARRPAASAADERDLPVRRARRRLSCDRGTHRIADAGAGARRQRRPQPPLRPLPLRVRRGRRRAPTTPRFASSTTGAAARRRSTPRSSSRSAAAATSIRSTRRPSAAASTCSRT